MIIWRSNFNWPPRHGAGQENGNGFDARPQATKKQKRRAAVIAVIVVVILALLNFFVMLTPINLHNTGFWMLLVFLTLIFAAVYHLQLLKYRTGNPDQTAGNKRKLSIGSGKLFLIPAGIFLIMIILQFSGATIFHAGSYASILQIQDAEFSQDLSETAGTDSIALMDTDSASMLGDREIGSLSNVVSQYDVSGDYTQIDYNGSPMKVSALAYAGFFKWFNNKSSGVPGYVTVNPVSMSADYKECEKGMIYVPSAYFLQDAARRIWMHYPTEITGNLHFEIDEDGNPYYICSTYAYKISLFGGETVDGCIILDPVTGEVTRYSLADVPTWVDVVFDGYLLCEQYNWYGQLSNGFINSLIAKKGCKQITTYYSDSEDDDAPASDFGYVAKDGDIWIYTGVTSVNGDSSNIGFLLADERTGEAHYFNISGADEKSAMAAAEGEVQEKGYQASFPSLINVNGNPTYIMVLKDASGLVKLYAAVNVEQYNLVTTATTQAECMKKYRALLGIESADTSETDEEDADGQESLEAEEEKTITIKEIKYIDVDGNTYIYLISDSEEIFRAKASTHEEMLLLEAGDKVKLGVSGKEIVTCEAAS